MQPEVGAAHVVADLRHRRRQFGLAGADHRLAGRDAPSALAAELEGHRHAEGLARRLFLELDRQLRVRMLAGGREPGRIDWTPEPGRGNHRVDEDRAVDRGRQRQRLAWRRPARPRLRHPGLREASAATSRASHPAAATLHAAYGRLTRVRPIDRSSWCRPHDQRMTWRMQDYHVGVDAMRILLVEDDPHAAQVLAKGLREQAYAVDLAADGAAAVMQAGITTTTRVVLDVMLPEVDGLGSAGRFAQPAAPFPS